MNKLHKMLCLASLCLAATIPATRAQTTNADANRSAAELQKKWFEPDESDIHYRFTIELDKDETMTVKLRKLSDWVSPEHFKSSFTATRQVMEVYRDSLKQEQNTRSLDIYLPTNHKNIIARFSQTAEAANLTTISSEGAAALKLGIDTLRILQAGAGNSSQIQYTFLLKSLSNYNAYMQDDAWINRTADKIDSIVIAYRSKWKHPDAARHQLKVNYNPTTRNITLRSGRELGGGTLIIDGGMGMSLVRNTLCPNVDIGIGVYLGNPGKERVGFARFSGSAFYRFDEVSTDHYKIYENAYLNLEFGSEERHSDGKSIFYKSSLGIGYKLQAKHSEDRDPTMSEHMYRLFFNYSVNKFLVLTPEFYTNLKRGDNRNAWFGVSLNLRLF